MENDKCRNDLEQKGKLEEEQQHRIKATKDEKKEKLTVGRQQGAERKRAALSVHLPALPCRRTYYPCTAVPPCILPLHCRAAVHITPALPCRRAYYRTFGSDVECTWCRTG
jgi:hypothetical protein